MPRFTLSAAEQTRLVDDLAVLASPLRHPTLADWQRAVLERLKASLGADTGAFLFPVNGQPTPFSDDLSLATCEAYPAAIRLLDQRWSLWRRMAEVGAFTRETSWGPHLPAVLRSAYQHEYIVPNRLHDGAGFTHYLPGVGPAPDVNTVATVWLHHARPTGRAFGDRGLATLRLLMPAFVAGAEAWHRLGAERARLGRTLDALGVAALVADLGGVVVHRTPALNALVRRDADGRSLDAQLRIVSATMAGLASGRLARGSADAAAVASAAGGAARTITTVSGRYYCRATLVDLDGAAGPGGGSLLLTLEPAAGAAAAPGLAGGTAAALADRHGFTRAQARVAQLIADGVSAHGVAARLGTSLHTTRRHLEQIRRRLNVRTTAAAVAALHGRVAGHAAGHPGAAYIE